MSLTSGKIGFLLFIFCFPSLFLSLTSINTPIILTWDGFLYLSSAKSLFTHEFGAYYHLIREPLYPFFLFLFYKIDGIFDIQKIVFVQNLILGQSISMTYYFLWKWFNFKKSPIILSLLFTMFLTIGYANIILQQNFFICSVLLVFILVLKIIISKNKNLFLLLAVLFSAILITSLSIIIFIGTLLTFITFLFIRSLRVSSLKLILVLLIGGFILIIPWYTFKNQYFENMSGDSVNFWERNKETNFSQIIKTAPTIFLGINSIGPEYDNSNNPENPFREIAFENSIFMFSQFSESEICGRVYPAIPEIVSFVSGNIEFKCSKTKSVLDFRNSIFEITSYFLPALGILNLALLLGLIVKRYVITFAFLPAYFLQVPYILSLSASSRFGYPALALTSILILIFFAPVEKLNRNVE
jgi:hypothetical protein